MANISPRAPPRRSWITTFSTSNENIAESKNVVRDKNVMSSMTGPVSGAKGKKNWEQLQQESEASDGVQVRN